MKTYMISYAFERYISDRIQSGQGRVFVDTPGPITVADVEETERQVERDHNFTNVAALAVSEIPGGGTSS
jgi:hypothetical protein